MKKRGLTSSVLVVLLGACTISSGQTLMYEYQDDFTSDKAAQECLLNSPFWSEGAYPPPESCLQFNALGHDRNLVFLGSQGRPAYLGYQFPPEGALPGPIHGTMSVDVVYPPDSNNGLFCSFSADGYTWSRPTLLPEGRQVLDMTAAQGRCLLIFLGDHAAIDNLVVRLHTPAATIIVPRDYSTIQEAIDRARDGDVIELAPGVYRGRGNMDLQLRGKAITLRGAAGADKTVILCEDNTAAAVANRRGFYIHEGEGRDCVIQGLTIRSGSAWRGSLAIEDLSAWVPSASDPIGGGIFCENSSPTIVACRIVACSARVGGGIACVGGKPLLADCAVEKCTTGPAGARGLGGGLALLGSAHARIYRSTFQNNDGSGWGGGLYLGHSKATLRDCRILANGEGGDLAGGGGVYAAGPASELLLQNCILAQNAAANGAGIFAIRKPEAAATTDAARSCILQIVNCTIADNRISNRAVDASASAGVFARGCEVTIRNSVLWQEQALSLVLSDDPGGPAVSYCDIRGGYPGPGNIDMDPAFAARKTGDYHLQSRAGRFDPDLAAWVADKIHSPCINAGDPRDSFEYEPPAHGRRINMGAFGGTCQASKSKGPLVYHVDTLRGRDTFSGLHQEEAFATIQRGLEAARDDDVVMVWPGLYREEVDFLGKAVTIQSAGGAAIVSAPRGYAFSFYHGERPASVLRNLVIQGSKYAVFCSGGVRPTLTNLTVVDNQFGVVAYDGALPVIRNCIFWNNVLGDLFQCTAQYSRVQNPWDAGGPGNLRVDPLFADPSRNDYHLLSQWGRYVPQSDRWVLDLATSPCIDAGSPEVEPVSEPRPNGGFLDMGVFGGTSHASLSVSTNASDEKFDGAEAAFFEGMDLVRWLTKPPPPAKQDSTGGD